jgi:HEAT repeat protein
MRNGRLVFVLAAACFFALCTLPAARGAEKTLDPDEQLLKEAKIGTDNASLLAYLRKHSESEDLEHIDLLIRQLGSKEFAQREQAAAKLIALRLLGLPALRQAQTHPDAEIAKRAKACLQQISRDTRWSPPLAVVRLLVRRKPPEALEALLHYLPFADEEVEEEIWFGVNSLVGKPDKVHPALLAALNDRRPSRRALAGCLVGRLGSEEQRKTTLKLLEDPDLHVRLRTSQGLLAGGNKSPIPVLIDLLAAPTTQLAWQAEELLRWVAGEDSPELTLGTGVRASRKKCQRAWLEWWEGNKNCELGKVLESSRRPGLVLLSGRVVNRKGEDTWLCGWDGKPRCRWESREGCDLRVQFLSNDRVLIAETTNPDVARPPVPRELRLSIRSIGGKVLWKDKRARSPAVCQMLANGNVFLNHVRSFEEITLEGTTVDSQEYDDEVWPCSSVQRLSNGHMIGLAYSSDDKPWRIWEVDIATNKTIRTLTLRPERCAASSLYPLANGGFLLTAIRSGCVVQVAASGQDIRKWSVPYAKHAPPLRNGNMLVVARGTVLEIDRQGKRMWESFPEQGGASDGIIYAQTCFPLLRLGLDFPRPRDYDQDSISYRTKSLDSKDVLTRRRAARLLAELGTTSAPAVERLVQALADADEEVRESAVEALGNIGPKAVPALLSALKSGKVRIRAGALAAMGLQPAQAKVLVPEMIKAVKDTSPEVRCGAVSSLGHMGREARSAVPVLIKALCDGNRDVRLSTLYAMVRLGPVAEAAAPTLVGIVKTQDEQLSRIAAYALGSTSPKSKELTASLKAALANKGLVANHPSIILALAAVSSDDLEVLGVLVQALRKPETKDPQLITRIRLTTTRVLRDLTVHSDEAIATLTELLKDAKVDVDLRCACAEALGEMGPSARSALPVLREAKTSKIPKLAGQAAKAIEILERPTK